MTYQEKIADIRQQGGINFHFPRLKNGGVKPGLWSHLCYSYDSSKRHFAFVHNGAIEVNYTNVPLAFEVSDGLPKSIFTPAYRYPGNVWKSEFWNKNCVFLPKPRNEWEPYCEDRSHEQNLGHTMFMWDYTFVGYVTDKNIWSRSLSIPEMIAWTTCESYETGNLLPWNADDWDPIQVDDDGNPIIVHDNVVVESDSFCQKPSSNGKTYTMFADNILNFYDGLKICKQFGGTMAHTRTMEEDAVVRGFIQKLRDTSANWKEVLSTGLIWYRYLDEEEEGVWKDPETGFIASFMNCPNDPKDCFGVIPWYLVHEPEGGRGENCVGGLENKKAEGSSYDITCDYLGSVVCEEASKQIVLRGLCPLSRIGKKYLMAQEPKERRRFFKGYTGWILAFEEEESIWTLKSAQAEKTFAKFTANKNYPMGRKDWMVTNDVCHGAGEHQMSLVLSACKDDQFTCDDGVCIDMASRCDRIEDCSVTILKLIFPINGHSYF